MSEGAYNYTRTQQAILTDGRRGRHRRWHGTLDDRGQPRCDPGPMRRKGTTWWWSPSHV